MWRLFGIFLLCFALSNSEPVCSRFHYEEQTLKKMLMVELLVERLKTELEGTTKTVNEAISELENEREVSKREHDQLQTSVKNDIERIIEEFGQMKESVKENVLFSAREIKNRSPSKGETLVFGHTITNSGFAYDNTTGIFTAPVGGVYMFTLQICVLDSKYVYFEIVVDNVPLLKGVNLDDHSQWSQCYTSTVPSFVNAGKQVWVKTGRNNADTLWESASENWNMFSGVLIHK